MTEKREMHSLSINPSLAIPFNFPFETLITKKRRLSLSFQTCLFYSLCQAEVFEPDIGFHALRGAVRHAIALHLGHGR